jgi:GDPmannose 4,6-dehydratase
LKTAIVTGITGQDGSYLAEHLLSKGYKVIGLKRRTSLLNTERIDHLFNNSQFEMKYWELNDIGSLYRIIDQNQPEEFYNLAAQSHVRVSFDIPESTVDSVAIGPLRIVEAIRNSCREIKFYQASSSEMYGDAPCPVTGYTEDSRMTPASPYACAKLFSHNLVRNYRESYKLHASSGILFNHESPRRGETFVTRKITRAAVRIKLGIDKNFELGNLDAKRDWGHAKDYVEAMWMMLQQQTPDDYVIATGQTNTVREFMELVFGFANLDPYDFLKINERLFRPHEVPYLLGDSTKAKEKLGWKPKYNLKQLAEEMYFSDLEQQKRSIK